MAKSFKDVCIVKKDGKEIKRGAFSTIAQALHSSQDTLRHHAKNGTRFKGYELEYVRIKYIYNAYLGDKLLHRGHRNDIAVAMNISPSTILTYTNSGKLFKGKYRFVLEETITPIVDKPKTKKSKHELDYEYLRKHLSVYGNTFFNKDPTDLIWELRENEGWNIRALPKEKDRWVLEKKS